MTVGMIGRQAILDRKGELFAYELLYRDSNINIATILDPTQATCTVMLHALTHFGLKNLVGGKKAFINIGAQLLLDPLIETLPKEHFVLEILEDVIIDREMEQRIKYLHNKGYSFALDDLIFEKDLLENFKPIFEYIEILKFDILQTGTADLEEKLAYFKDYKIEYLAEKVESKKVYQACQELGFDYFQGYYFCKPDLLSKQKIDPSSLLILKLIELLLNDAPIEKINTEFHKSPHLSINLLKYLNSAYLSFATDIKSIPHAIMLLGRSQLAQWLTLYLYNTTSQNSFSSSIINRALFQAKFMQELAALLEYDNKFQEKGYLTGMLSLVDALLNVSMHEIFDEIRIDQEISDALQHKKGPLYQLLQISQMVEKNDPRALEILQTLGIYPQEHDTIIKNCYKWVNQDFL